MDHTQQKNAKAVRIEPFQPTDLPIIARFVEAIQEHERTRVPELKAGAEISVSYAKYLVHTAEQKKGVIGLAKAGRDAIGFCCAWIAEDDDALLRDDARHHAYISDIFVISDWRGKGIAQMLLEFVEAHMRSRGCTRIRVCSKATNAEALKCYEAGGYSPYEVIFSKPL